MTSTIRDLKVELMATTWLKPDPRNARTHSKKQIAQIAAAIQQFGWTNPILTDGENNVLAGHARLEAAKQLDLKVVPVIRLADMTQTQKRAYILADNKLAENAGWDSDILKTEFEAIGALDINFDLTLTGFAMGEIDVTLGAAPVAPAAKQAQRVVDAAENGETAGDAADLLPEVDPDRPVITKPGDLWVLGSHRLLCGDARDIEHLRVLLEDDPAHMVFTDPPYNVPIDRHVCGLGVVKHDEFAMASGEMSEAEFTDFLSTVIANLVHATHEGSIHFLCMDWRHVFELLKAGRQRYAELKNICVWNKSNGGMGSLYRSKHELVAVFKNGGAPHTNNVELGRHGRSRCNVWDYPGVNGFGKERDLLAIHPTVKPVQLVADAIMDCSNRGERILDVFCGSGTTLIAAEQTGRIGFGLEIEPKYVDAALRRFRALTGVEPVRESDGATLKQLE